ncbi:MAG: tRNA pseudouridine(38-40) synthase TruA [Akkermansiaceae bacterium]|nr:tRNA pseudouridine(38-40) synthase TruA [Akkermansiaceae bacterium]
MKVLLTLAYDGTAYQGWQSQPNGMAVQNQLEHAFERILGEIPPIEGAARTDAGVHAHAMTAHVELPAGRFRLPLQALPLALNRHLPEDVRVVAAIPVAATFHARFDAMGKTYRYRIWNHPVMHPLRRHHCWHVPQALNLDAMQEAAALLMGRHDFRAFTITCPGKLRDPHCTLASCGIRQRSHAITLQFRADRFLFRMCRTLTGTLVQIGQGRLDSADLARFLQPKLFDPEFRAGMVAPAHGLTLWRIHYRRE